LKKQANIMPLKKLFNKNCQHYFLLFIINYILLFPLNLNACEGPYKNKSITNEQLESILARHALFEKRAKKLKNEEIEKPDFNDKDRANLCGADLSGLHLQNVKLSHADLREVNLSNTELNYANLHRAWLDDANLSNTNLIGADLSNAFLYGANLSQSKLHNANLSEAQMKEAYLDDSELHNANLQKADLEGVSLNYAQLNNADLSYAKLDYANLSRALLFYTNLTSANLQWADLSYAHLSETVMTEALLHNANLDRVFYFPKVGTYPDISGFTQAINYEQMDYYADKIGISPGILALRSAYESAGMRHMEREFTYLIQSQEQSANWKKGGWSKFVSVMTYIFFDLPCAYGLYPQRPIKILFSLLFIFWIIYWISLRFGFKGARLNIVWPSCIPSKDVTYYKPFKFSKSRFLRNNLQSEITFMRVALHLSTLSAFRLGWRDFNIGVWLSYLQFHAYSLKVRKGWLRSLCGLQSLVSMYMFSLWAMTQFGRPFG